MKLIDGDALHIETIGVCDANGNVYGSAEVVFAEDITNAPTIDPVKHGRWQEGYNGDLICACEQLKAYYLNLCSVCKEPSPQRYRYCPHCGVRMDADE